MQNPVLNSLENMNMKNRGSFLVKVFLYDHAIKTTHLFILIISFTNPFRKYFDLLHIYKHIITGASIIGL